MTPLMKVYDAFLSKVGEDDWAQCRDEEDLKEFLQDWFSILKAARAYFKFPRCGLDIDEENQVFCDRKMGDDEIQVLAVYMKQEWLKRTIDTWENIKTQYEESDFSQAKLLATFIKLREVVKEEAKEKESLYYRSINNKPFKFRRLSGGGGRGRNRR